MLGRSVRTETTAFDGTATGANKVYDARGNVSGTEQLHKSGETFISTAFGYDNYNRVNSVNAGALGTTTYAYSYGSGNTTVATTTPSGSSSKVTDITGRITSATDNGGTLAYVFNSHGGPKTVTHASATTNTNEYDTYGRQTKLIDLNAGTTEYLYNAFGELVWQKNANGAEHTMVYDPAGRIASRTGPEGTITYEYFTDNSSGKSKGKIKKITGFATNNWTNYEYNSNGQLLNRKETIDNILHTTSYTYNAYGDVATTTYPSGLQITHNYNGNGYLTSMSGAGTTLYTTTAMNGQGQVTTYTKSSIASSVVYENGFPKTYSTSGIQNYQLTWDYTKGTVSKRVDGRSPARTENFTYDNLNRLTGAAVAGITPAFAATYAPNGNIGTKSDAGTYTYHPSKINAVAAVTNPAPAPIPALQQVITYTVFNQPETVSENNYMLTYTYGADNNRIKSELKLGGATQYTRYYFAGGFEKTGVGTPDRYLQYITSPAGLIAIIESNGGSHTVHYTYTDHLGSILTVANTSGTIEAEQSFDAWGRRRNPTSWALLSPTAATGLPTWLIRGYTSHEHLDQFGLINMNGRMYDPVVGRMLSPDNYVPDGSRTQDYNRYSYARNNPLIYTDPDGEFVVEAIVLGAMVGAFFGMIKASQNGQHELSGAWKGAVVGGFAGFLGGVAPIGLGPGLLYGAAAGLVTGAANAALWKENIFKGALSGAIIGGVTGGTAGYLRKTALVKSIFDKSRYLAFCDECKAVFGSGNGFIFDHVNISTMRNVPNYANWFSNAFTAYEMFILWQAGVGEVSIFDGDRVADAMSNAYGVGQARDFFYKKYRGTSNLEGASVTDFGVDFGLKDLFWRAGIDPIEQYVGSYNVDIYVIDKTTIKFSLINNTSFKSFSYGQGPSWNSGPMRNYWQVYEFTEQINYSKLR